MFCLSIKPGATIPVRVAGRIVAILAPEPVVGVVIQIPEAPGAPDASRVRAIEAATSREAARSRHETLGNKVLAGTFLLCSFSPPIQRCLCHTAALPERNAAGITG